MISCDEFCRIINEVKDWYDYSSELDLMLSKKGGCTIDSGMSDLTIKLLDDFAIPNEGNWCQYFCWEGNFGRSLDPDSVSVDGKPCDITTPEKLYHFLLTNSKN